MNRRAEADLVNAGVSGWPGQARPWRAEGCAEPKI